MKLFEVKSNLIWSKSDLCLLYNSFNKTDTSTFHLCLRLSFETSFLITHILIQCENCGNEIDRCFVTCLFRSLYSSHFCPFILRVTDEVSRTTKYSSFTEIRMNLNEHKTNWTIMNLSYMLEKTVECRFFL